MKLKNLAACLLSFAAVNTMALAALAQSEAATEATSTTKTSGQTENVGAATGMSESTAEALAPTTEGTTAQWQLNLSSESTVNAKAQQQDGADAQFTSLNGIGAIYNLSNRTQFELRQYFEYASKIETLSGRAKQLHQNENEMSNTVLRAATKAFSVFKSKVISWEGRFYLPNDRLGVENKETGYLRLEAITSWDLNPKWTVGAYMRAATLLNSKENPNAAKGSDAQYYRLLTAPSLTYNFTDKVGAYYAYNVETWAGEAQRGIYRPDVLNEALHEVGLLWTLGPVLINPTMISEVSHDNADASLFTQNSRYFASDNTTYNLNLYATF